MAAFYRFVAAAVRPGARRVRRQQQHDGPFFVVDLGHLRAVGLVREPVREPAHRAPTRPPAGPIRTRRGRRSREQLPALVDERAVPLVPRGARRRSGVLHRRPNYFDLLKTTATTPSGNPKDQFHFTYSTAEWVALSQSGVEAGYGAQLVVARSRPPRNVVVAYAEPGLARATAPASRAGARCSPSTASTSSTPPTAPASHAERRALPVGGRRVAHVLGPRRRREHAADDHHGLGQR